MKVYRVLAYLIALEVVIQAAAIAFGVFGLGHWIDKGAVADKATLEDNPKFTGAAGFAIHSINGTTVIPVLALALLIVSFFTRSSVQGAVKWAGIVVGVVVLQVFLGLLSHDLVGLGPLHGINAFALLAVAAIAARRASPVAVPQEQETVV
jgi:heme A synthase